jgi:predicted ATPase/DNA-binding winged helix-turn-helix (wHTH) protein
MSLELDSAVGERLKFGEFELAPVARALWRRGEQVKLGSRALEILIALASRPGQIVSKDDLTQLVWRGAFVDETALRVGISAVRKALGPGGDRYIATVPCRGYCFVRDVETTATKPTPERSHFKRLKPQRLPAQIARVVGRDEVLVALAAEANRHRLLSLVGPGGIGKTTVALELARKLDNSYKDHAHFVDLASLADPRLVSTAVASTFEFQTLARDPLAELVVLLQDKEALLVLDNCEHLIEAVAVLTERIIAEAPGVHILATSREPLRATGEWVHRLSSLELPPTAPAPSAAEALSFSAIQLFTERAMASLESFRLTDANTPIVADICRRVEGIPLAIELAAARVDSFGIQELADRLGDQLSVLANGRRTALPRHRTIRATLDWSYQLLPPTEQVMLCRLAIFRGTFTLASATAVATCEKFRDVFDPIANLVAKSLITADVSGEIVHYRLLDITRAYAMEKLEQRGEYAVMSGRRAAYCCAVLDTAERDWERQSKTEWLRSYARLIDDVRAALDWAFSSTGDESLGIALTAASTPIWFALSLVREYRERAQRALEAIPTALVAKPELEMKINVALGAAIFNTQGIVPGIATAYARALEIAEHLGAPTYALRALWGLARERYVQGDYRAALTFCERFGQLAETSGDQAAGLVHDRMMALALHLVGRQAQARPYADRTLNHPAAAIRTAHKSFQEYDNRVAARSHLARILWVQGFPDQAAAIAQEGVAHGLSLEYPPPLCYILAYAACPIAFWNGDTATATSYVQLLLRQSANLSFGYWRSWRYCYEQVAVLGDDDGTFEFKQRLDALRASAISPIYSDLLSTLREDLSGPATIARAEAGEAGWCTAEILRVKGIKILKHGGANAAETAEVALLRSLDIALQQGAHAWELRTATSLARLWRDQGKPQRARELLSPVYGWFTEGFDTRDLKEAKALLDELHV